MKKAKWFLATPLLLTPALSLIPVVTSCSKADVTVSSEFANNVDVENITQELHEEEPYLIKFSIKQDKVGSEFLPSTLTKVTSGGTELTQLDVSKTSNEYDYYSYYVNDDHTIGLLTILSAKGSIGIEATTTQLNSVTATAVDLITGGTTAEFEIGETIGDLATRSRVIAVANLENGEYFSVTSEYTFKLDGYESGTKFTTEQTTTKKGKVVYCGKESNEFDFKVIKTTQAYLSYPVEGQEENKVVKYSSINEAVDDYDELDTAGSYTITIPSSSEPYTLNEPLDIEQDPNKHLLITTDWLENVKLQANYNDEDYLMQISYTGDSASANTSITIDGITFEKPTTNESTFNDIVLRDDSSDDAPHNITINNCSFVGDEDDDGVKVNAVYSDNTAGQLTPYGIVINACSGYFLNTLFSGPISHKSSNLLDLTIAACYTSCAQQVIDVSSTTDCRVLIDGVIGSVLYTKDETAASVRSAMTITGAGTYWIRNCILTQLASTSAETGGFIEVTAVTQGSDQTRELILSGLKFISADQNMHTVYDSYTNDGVDWNIEYEDDEGMITTATVCSYPTDPESDTWDIPE